MLDRLTSSERELIRACLRAAVEGPFFEEWEFQTLFGLTREQVRAIADEWPPTAPLTPTVSLAIRSSLNNLFGYPHDQSDELRRRLGITPERLQHLMNRMDGEVADGE